MFCSYVIFAQYLKHCFIVLSLRPNVVKTHQKPSISLFPPIMTPSSPDLSGDAPEEALALVAVGGGRGRPQHEVVRRRARDRVDQRLQRLLVHMHFLGRQWPQTGATNA